MKTILRLLASIAGLCSVTVASAQTVPCYTAAQCAERVGPAARALEADLDVPGGPDEVVVVVDQPGDHGSAAEVGHPRVRRRACQDGRVLAYRRDPLPLNRHRLADGKLLVHRDDLPVDEDESSHASLSRA